MKRSHVLIALAAFACGLSIGFILIREPMEPLTAAALERAQERWHEAGVTSYSTRYQLNADSYEVTVDDRIVTSIRVNGQPPTTSDLRNYTVEGLFRVLEMEIENMTDPSGSLALQKNALLARVRFNKERGYVERYLRSSSGIGRSASIQVLEFKVTD